MGKAECFCRLCGRYRFDNMTGRSRNRLGVRIGHESWDCLFPGFGQQCRLFRRGIQREGLRRMDGSRIAVAG